MTATASYSHQMFNTLCQSDCVMLCLTKIFFLFWIGPDISMDRNNFYMFRGLFKKILMYSRHRVGFSVLYQSVIFLLVSFINIFTPLTSSGNTNSLCTLLLSLTKHSWSSATKAQHSGVVLEYIWKSSTDRRTLPHKQDRTGHGCSDV